MIVVDTNVLSELMRTTPATAVAHWAGSVPGRELHTTSLCIAEVRHGIRRLPAGRRREELAAAADEVFMAFTDRVLPFDLDAAEAYPAVVLERERLGAPIVGFDAQIAAICRHRGAGLATRNTRDFDHLGLTLVDPWRSSTP